MTDGQMRFAASDIARREDIATQAVDGAVRLIVPQPDGPHISIWLRPETADGLAMNLFTTANEARSQREARSKR